MGNKAQALSSLQEGNLALQGGEFTQAIAAYSAGLRHMPQSCGLLLNRSIAYEKAYQEGGNLAQKQLAFEDLGAYLNLTNAEESGQNHIALKRFVTLGIELGQLQVTLRQLKQLEEKEFWYSADFYDVLIGLILANPGSEDTLAHYVVRASQFTCLTQNTLERVCQFLSLHAQSTEQCIQGKSDPVENLLLELVFSDHAPAFLVKVWLEYALPKLPTQALRSNKIIEILSLWKSRHELDQELAEILISSLAEQNQIDHLQAVFLDLAQRHPDDPYYMLGLVKTHVLKREPRNAHVIISALLDADPQNHELRLERARITADLNNPEMSLADVNYILKEDPIHFWSMLLKADILVDMGRLDEALVIHEEISRHDLTQSQQLDSAIQKCFIYRIAGMEQEWFEQVDRIAEQFPGLPQTLCEMGWKELYLDDWKNGLAHLEARYDGRGHYFALEPHLANSPLKSWSLETMAGDVKGKRLLLVAEGGLGDAVQYARFIPLLLDKGMQITFACQDALQSLFALNYPSVLVQTKKEFFEDLPKGLTASYDFYGTLMSAPYVLGLELKDLQSKAYLKADTQKIAEWGAKLPTLSESSSGNAPQKPLRIGLRWMGNFSRVARKIDLEYFSPLAKLPIEIVGLQYGNPNKADRELYEQWENFHPTNLLIDDLAALMMNLDCVVTCDTVTAHLAGALGRPTILIKPVWTVWVWGRSGHQSRWYDSMHIIRQQQFLNWDSAIAELLDQLQQKIQELG